MMKKSFSLGLLMSCLIVGNVAFAENVNVSGDQTFSGENIVVGTGESFNNQGQLTADSITINNGLFTNSGDIETNNLDILAGHHNGVNFNGGTINASENIIYRGTQSNHYGLSLNDTKLVTKELTIMGNSSNQIGLGVTTTDNLAGVEKINVISEGGKTGLVINGENIDINSEVHLVHSGGNDARIEVYDGASATFDTVYSDEGKNKIQVNGKGYVKVNNIIVDNPDGYLSLQTNGIGEYATYDLENIVIKDNSQLKTCVYGSNPGAHITGDNVNITLGNNSIADFAAAAASNADWDGERINFDAEKLTVHVNGDDSNVYISDVSKIKNENITVVGNADKWTGNIEQDLTELAGVVIRAEDVSSSGDDYYVTSIANGVNVEQKGGEITDGYKGVVASDDNNQIKVDNIQVVKNSNVYGIAENNALSLITWRNEMDDLNKRMGELRNSNGEHGVWVRMVRGESEYESIKNQYNTYQLGYDEKLSTDSTWTVGGAISYTEGTSGYETGSAENKHKGFALYGSKLNSDGSFIDIIAKYANIDNDFVTTIGNGDFDMNAYSLSAEYGKRFQQGNGVWIEPQVQLSYGTVDSANYNIGDVSVNQDSIDSVVGRLGFSIGKDIDRGNVYLRASYLYDFDGETSVTYASKNGEVRTLDQDLGGGWFEVGIGTNLNISDNSYLYLDVERTYGGDVETPWQWNAGMRFTF